MLKLSLSLFSALLFLGGCSDVTPQVSFLKGQTPSPSTGNLTGDSYIKTDLASHVVSTSAGGFKLEATVSKEDSSTQLVSSQGYLLILNEDVD